VTRAPLAGFFWSSAIGKPDLEDHVTRSRSFTCTAAAAALFAAACDADSAGPEPRPDAGVHFTGGTAIYAANGSPAVQADGDLLNEEFAVARPDSVGGFAVISFDPTGGDVGNLFVLQAPRSTGSVACGLFTGEPCRGVYVVGVRPGSPQTVDRRFFITAGSVTVTQVGPDRLRGTFAITLEAQDGLPDASLTVENGTIDVPYVGDEVTDGALVCLLSLIGIGDGPCRG
jgi:hypothetical protein